MSASFKIIDTIEDIEKNINLILAQQINDTISRGLSSLQSDLINFAVPEWLDEQPEIQALKNGSLSGPFGFTTSPLNVADAIISSIASSTSVSLSPYNRSLKGGGLTIAIQPNDFSNLLSLPEGHTVYEDGDLHWLDWMINRGDEIIIVGYEYNPTTGLGRTKLGNMKEGRFFRVPPQYAGTAQNNFVTRALSGSKQLRYMTNRIKTMLGA